MFRFFQYRIVLNSAFFNPDLSRSSTPGRNDYANRYIQFLLQFTCKEIAGGTGCPHGFGRAHCPCCIAGLLWIIRSNFLDMKNADIWILCFGCFFFAVDQLPVDTHFHVRLTTAQPYFTQHHIVQSQATISNDLNRIWATRFNRFDGGFHSEELSAFTFTVSLLFQLVTILTVSPGLDQPQIATSEFCCSTMLSAKTDGRTIFPNMVELNTERIIRVKKMCFMGNWLNFMFFTKSKGKSFKLKAVSYTHLTLPTKRIV